MLVGPDVSWAQGTIDWSHVKVEKHTLAFAIAQATHDTSGVDSNFGANWHGIHARGLLRGAYHFADLSAARGGPQASAVVQARLFLGELARVGSPHGGELPPALDIEQPCGLSPSELHEFVQTWVEHVEASVGRKPMIYTSPSFWSEYLAPGEHDFGCLLWLADQDIRVPAVPRAWSRWTFWQMGIWPVSGFPKPVDMNSFNGTIEELRDLAGARPRPHPPHDPPRPPEPHGIPQAPVRPLRNGDHGAAVSEWQQQMRRRGFVGLRIDGQFGPECSRCCRWLQRYLGLPVTEEVDERLWRATWQAP